MDEDVLRALAEKAHDTRAEFGSSNLDTHESKRAAMNNAMLFFSREMSPETVLDLLDEIERLRAEVAARKSLDAWITENTPLGWIDDMRAELDRLTQGGGA